MTTNITIPTRLFEELVAAVRSADHLGSCCLHESTHAAPAFGSMRRFVAQAMYSLHQLESMKRDGPTHTHDCDKCEYIASTFNHAGERHDWYYCDQPGLGDTVLCRRSSEGSDYSSYPGVLLKSMGDTIATDNCGRRAMVTDMILAKSILAMWHQRQSAKLIAEGMAASAGKEHG